MTKRFAPFAMVLAVGCGQAKPDPAPPPEPAHVDAAQPATTPADAACDSIIALGRRVLDIEVRRTAAREVENPFARARPRVRPGCRVTGADPADRNPSPIDGVYQSLERAGWKPLLQYQADGPDGSVVASCGRPSSVSSPVVGTEAPTPRCCRLIPWVGLRRAT